VKKVNKSEKCGVLLFVWFQSESEGCWC